ncbi:MAG TPA: helix-turn-helix domain-containing protein [Thermoanaerobaculia bacterium]|nr:helix-turn-helix domain-containing protein [Thermoanaerobaculia bacterium]
MSPGAFLCYARRKSGQSQRQLAFRAGVSQPEVARVESGRSQPRIDTLQRLLRAAGYRLCLEPAPEANVDRTTIRRLLALSPAERLELATREAANLEDLLSATRRVE